MLWEGIIKSTLFLSKKEVRNFIYLKIWNLGIMKWQVLKSYNYDNICSYITCRFLYIHVLGGVLFFGGEGSEDGYVGLSFKWKECLHIYRYLITVDAKHLINFHYTGVFIVFCIG